MSKQITAGALASVVTRLLTDDSVGELSGAEIYAGFMTDLTKLVCQYCGGEVRQEAAPLDHVWYVGVHGNDSLPDAFGGVWRDIDREGELWDGDIPDHLEAGLDAAAYS